MGSERPVESEEVQMQPPRLLRKRKQHHRQLNLETGNDNDWSTSLYSKPPLLTSARCVGALHEFFDTPDVLAIATESSSHPTGLTSVLAQPWLYAGPGLGNIPECPLQTCLAGAGTRRDSITFASVCIPYECRASDLAAADFSAWLERAAQHTLDLKDFPDDDDYAFEFIENPERKEQHEKAVGIAKSGKNVTQMDDDPSIWWHISHSQQREWAQEYINLNQRISKLNAFLQTGWTCGNYRVPWHAYPFGLPYLFICGGIVILTFLATCRRKHEPRCKNQTVLIETDERSKLVFQKTPSPVNSEAMSATSSAHTSTSPNHDVKSSASLSSDTSTDQATTRNNSNDQASGSHLPNARIHVIQAQSHQEQEEFEEDYSIVSNWNIYTNWDKLCNSRHEATACLDGLRVWSILWVMLGHVMAIQSSTAGGYSNPVDFLPPTGFTTTFFGQLIFAARFAVDTFLAISGYLLVIVIARKAPSLLRQESNQTVTFFQLIGLRLLRIVPLYMMCLGFYTQIAPHLYLGGKHEGGGPFWYQWNSLLSPCRQYGWTNWLFVNNFVPFEKSNMETCFYHSWYLAVDMQLFVLFGLPITFFVFLKNPKFGRQITLALWWVSVLLTAYLSYVRDWSINTFDGLQVARFDIEGYAKPHIRGQAYLAGMYVAMWQLSKPRNTVHSGHTTRKHQVLLWIAILSLGFITFGTVTGAYARRPCQYSEFPSRDHCGSLWDPTATFLYTATSRAIWSCSIAVLMTVCLEGNGGWLNRFLSWRIWAPLSQLSFGVYLIHPIVIFVWLLGERQKNIFSLMTFSMTLLSVCVVSFALALIAFLSVELPMAALISQKVAGRIRRISPLASNQTSSEQVDRNCVQTRVNSSRETMELIPSSGIATKKYGTA